MKKLLFSLASIFMGFFTLIFIMFLILRHGQIWVDLQSHIENSIWIRIWRYGLYLLGFLIWPYIVRRCGEYNSWSADFIQILQLRWRYLYFIAFVEIFFSYNLVGCLIQCLQ